jgi:hypothetical protein
MILDFLFWGVLISDARILFGINQEFPDHVTSDKPSFYALDEARSKNGVIFFTSLFSLVPDTNKVK